MQQARMGVETIQCKQVQSETEATLISSVTLLTNNPVEKRTNQKWKKGNTKFVQKHKSTSKHNLFSLDALI